LGGLRNEFLFLGIFERVEFGEEISWEGFLELGKESW